MNTMLTKHIRVEEGKTRDQSIAAYAQAWEASKYLLGPVASMLKERLETLRTVRDDDFVVANHYGKIMFQKGKETEAAFLLSVLPKTLAD